MVTGAVLCGGRSRRMGVDKALLQHDGVVLAERVARALASGGCDPVVLVGGDGPALVTATGRAWIADRWPGEGPTGGVLTALQHTGDDVVVAACDLPDLDAATVAALVAAAGHGDVDVVQAVTDRPHLLAWWSAAAVDALAADWADGVRAVRDAVARRRAGSLVVAASAVRNVNEPTDLDGHARGRG